MVECTILKNAAGKVFTIDVAYNTMFVSLSILHYGILKKPKAREHRQLDYPSVRVEGLKVDPDLLA